MDQHFESIDAIQSALSQYRYIADRTLCTTLFLAQSLDKPLLLEGEPGVGKTQLAQVLAEMFNTKLIRLQCFEGIDSYSALYEWNYPKQLMDLRIRELKGQELSSIESDIFSEEYLLKRPLLEAIQPDDDSTPVLLIDEVDRADEEFEAFLLEVLSDFQISIPEIGTISSTKPPLVILTSNGTRELHGALKRRCLYHWIDYPDANQELEILEAKLPNIDHHLAKQVCGFVDLMRDDAFFKKPGIAETIDWAESLMALGVIDLQQETISATAGCLLKYKRDLERFGAGKIESFLEAVASGSAAAST